MDLLLLLTDLSHVLRENSLGSQVMELTRIRAEALEDRDHPVDTKKPGVPLQKKMWAGALEEASRSRESFCLPDHYGPLPGGVP